MIKLGVLGSTRGTDLKPIIDSINDNNLDAVVSCVISNQSDAHILKRAEYNKIEHYYISHKNKEREIFDSEISNILKSKSVDLVLLIGFMRILSTNFCKTWANKIINVHPSLLPKYGGGMDSNIHAEVLKNRDLESGCTIHFVTNEVDKGPIVLQKKCTVLKSDTVKSLKKKVQILEGAAFIESIKLIQKKYA